jgi:hypothetical protein
MKTFYKVWVSSVATLGLAFFGAINTTQASATEIIRESNGPAKVARVITTNNNCYGKTEREIKVVPKTYNESYCRPVVHEICVRQTPVQTPSYTPCRVIAPVCVKPVYVKPAYVKPVYAKPVYVEPVHVKTIYITKTIYVEPVRVTKVYVKPVYVKQVRTKPVYIKQACKEPVCEEPTAEQPAFDQPICDQPVCEQPTCEEPACDQPADDQADSDQVAPDQATPDQPSDDDQPASPPATYVGKIPLRYESDNYPMPTTHKTAYKPVTRPNTAKQVTNHTSSYSHK